MKKLTGLTLSLFCFILTQAQNVQPINSGEIIEKGTKLHDEGKYSQAIALYRKVPRNDSNYALAVYEIAFSQWKDSAFADALKTCEQGLQLSDDEYELQFYSIKGNVLDDKGDNEAAIQVFDQALKKYPNAENIMLNKAITLMRDKKYDAAEPILKELVLRDPYYASAHFKLGQIAMLKGQPVPAMLSFFTYLVTQPSGPYSNDAVKLLSMISNNNSDMAEYVANRSVQPTGSFALVEKILQSKIALDKNYKVITDFDDPIIRQLQVMMEKLQYQASDNDFWMQYYVPVYKNVFNNKHFEPIVFYAFSDINLEQIQTYVKRNQKPVNNALEAFAGFYNKIRATRILNFNEREKGEEIYHFSKMNLFAKGKLTGEKMNGYWEFYHTNGNVKSKGEYISDKKNGKWTYYFANGAVNGYEEWKNGVQHGEDQTFNKYGIVTTKLNYKEGKTDGEKLTYFGAGHLFTSEFFKDGKQYGPMKVYHANGNLKIDANVENDELHGNYTSYHSNGKLETKATYTNGKLNGPYKSYHENGQLSFEGNYVMGEIEGEIKEYHENGKLKRTASFKKSNLDGDELEYDIAGQLEQKYPYKNGKASGRAEFYDEGKLYSVFELDNDKLKKAIYYNKAGREISTSERQGKNIDLTVYNPLGFRAATVVYNDKNGKQGDHRFYYNSGQLKEINPYNDGELEGDVKGYYSNGAKEYEVNYKAGKREGLYRSYYITGKVKSEGWYINGELNGDWIEYNEKGFMDSRSTYLGDDLHGTREVFLPNGKLDYEEVFRNGWVLEYIQYDSTGKVIKTAKFDKSSGKYTGIHYTGKVKYEGTYQNSYLQGRYVINYFDGTPHVVKNFTRGELDGDYIDYHYGGIVANKGKYILGNKEGEWIGYSEDGKMWKKETYVNGKMEGKAFFYFPSGKVEREFSYRNGERHGTFTRYAEDGQVAYTITYKEDLPIGYSYPGKDGKLVAEIPIRGGNGKVLTYYANGNKSSEMQFRDGKIDGDYILYFPDGKLYYQSREVIGYTHGKLQEFTPTGSPKTDYNYEYNNQEGPYKEYHDNGKLSEEGSFNTGYLHGTRKFYNTAGKLTQKREYYYGILMSVTNEK